jgi:hypothetical protein
VLFVFAHEAAAIATEVAMMSLKIFFISFGSEDFP